MPQPMESPVCSFVPFITKATRITDHSYTLIDHIHTNVPEKKTIKAGICLADVSDHLPTFCTIANKLLIKTKTKYFRDFSKFDKANFFNALPNVNFRNLLTEDVNESMNKITQVLQQISDLHAPVWKASKQKRKLLKRTVDLESYLDCH